MMPANTKSAPTNQKYNAGIFLYNGVELLDFAGPGEVFAVAAGFNVYTVSTDGEEICSQGFVKIQPEYALKTVSKPDIVVFPGGNTEEISKNDEVLHWIKNLYEDETIIMSVCTGARILATAGLLENRKITTWNGFTDQLQKLVPSSTVLKNTRFVDSGQILTTAGVSAGIDGALHLLGRIMGKDVTESTARYMEYDRWQPEGGLVE